MRRTYTTLIIILAIALIAGFVVLKRKTTPIWVDSTSSNGLTMVMNRDNMYNFVNEYGSRITYMYKYSDAMPFCEGYTFVKMGEADTWTMIDTKGNCVGNCNFNEVKPFKNGYAWVKTDDGSANLIDTGCRLVLPQGQYIDVDQDVHDDVIIVQNYDGLYGYATTEGREIIKPAYKHVEPFTHELAQVKSGEYMTIINSKGEQLCPAIFAGFEITEDAVFPYIDEYEDKYGHKSDRKLYGVMTKEGKWLLPCCFTEYKAPSEGVVIMAVQNSSVSDRYYKYFSMTDGNELFNTSFKKATPFKNGKARVGWPHDEYDLDLQGNVVIDENERWLLGTWVSTMDALGYSKIRFTPGGNVALSFYAPYSSYSYGGGYGTFTANSNSVTLRLEDGSEFCEVISPTSMTMGKHHLTKIEDYKGSPKNKYLNKYTYTEEMYKANPWKRNVSQWYIGQWSDTEGNRAVITEDEFIYTVKGGKTERTKYLVSGPTVKATISGYGHFTLVQSSMVIKVKPESGGRYSSWSMYLESAAK